MALSPYTKPTNPWQPNGIAQYVAIANRPTVKASWDTWVESYHLVTRNNDNAVGPIATVSVLGAGRGYNSTGATFNLTALAGVIQTATVASGGSNYKVGQKLYIQGGSGANGALTVATISASGAVLTVTIATAGTGYANTETSLSTTTEYALSYQKIPITNIGSYESNIGLGTNAKIRVLTATPAGEILTVAISAAGTNYREGDLLLVGSPGVEGVLLVTSVTFTPQAYPAAFDYAGLYTNGAP